MAINRKAKRNFVVFAFTFLCLVFLLVGVVWGSGRIDNLSLQKEGDFTKVTIYADKPFEFSHFIQQTTEGKPYRLIIDCKNVIFGLPQHDFKEGLPSGTIEAIRTSQFQVDPERIVRIVLDLKGPVVYKVEETGAEKKATLTLLTTQDPDFPTWLAVKRANEEKNKPEEKKKEKPASSSTVVKASQGESRKGEYQALLKTIHDFLDQIASEKRAREAPQEDFVLKPEVSSSSDTSEAPLPKEEMAVLSAQTQPQVKDADVKSESESPAEKEAISLVSGKTKGLPETDLLKDKSEVPLAQIAEPKKAIESSPLPAEAERTEEDRTKVDISSSEKTLPIPPLQTKADESVLSSVSSSSSKETLPEQPTLQRKISRSPVPLGPYPEQKTQLAKNKTETGTETEREKDTVSEVGSPIQKGIGAILGTEGASAKEADTLLESSVIVPDSQMSELGLIPSRKVISYNPETKRDPFMPLTGKQDMSFGTAPLPRFENLKLVGIIRDKEGNQALLEDEMGFGYILKIGDKIKNGYVISVEDDKVVFHVEEYGGYKTMTLELNPEY